MLSEEEEPQYQQEETIGNIISHVVGLQRAQSFIKCIFHLLQTVPAEITVDA
jgi:hypothetical protein